MDGYAISEKATAIIETQPRFWEFQLFSRLLTDEITIQNEKIKRNINVKENIPHSFFIHSSATLRIYVEWLQSKLNDLSNLVPVFSNLLAENIETAFGPPGQAGNATEIISVARKAREFYINVLCFVQEVKLHRIELDKNDFGKIIGTSSTGALVAVRDNLISEGNHAARFYEGIGPEIERRIKQVLIMAENGTPVQLDLNFEFSINLDCSREIDSAVSLMNEISDNVRSEEDEEFILANPNCGTIYLLMNPSMPGLFKIGKTTRTTGERIKELNAATGVPTMFAVVYEAFVNDCHDAEKYVHERLNRYRVSNNREFFRLASSTAVDIIIEARQKFS